MRPTMRSLVVTLPMTAALAVAACEQPLDPEQASAQIGRQAADLARSTGQSLERSGGIDHLASGAGSGLQALVGPVAALTPRMPEMMKAARVPAPLARMARNDDQLERAIREQLFPRRNLESKNAFEAIYRLRPETTCRDPESGAVDPDCRRLLERVEVRLRVSAERAGHQIDLLIGRDRLRPVSLFLDDEGADLYLYLAPVKRSAQLIARALGEPDQTPEVLAGTVQISLRKEGEQKVTFSLGLLEMIELRDAGEGFAFRTAAARPALAIDLDGASGAIDSRVNVGLTEVSAPWSKGGPTARLVVPAVSGQAHAIANQDVARFQNLSLGAGATFIEVGGTRVFQLDLNPQSGRSFDAEVGPRRIAFHPGFALTAMFDLGAVPADQPPPAHLADQTYRLLISAAGGADPVLESFEGSHEGTLRIVDGRLDMSSNRTSRTVTATAGQCLASREPGPGEHPVIDSLALVPCP